MSDLTAVNPEGRKVASDALRALRDLRDDVEIKRDFFPTLHKAEQIVLERHPREIAEVAEELRTSGQPGDQGVES